MYSLTDTDIENIKAGKAVLLDVRSSDEVTAGKAKCAQHIDVNELSQRQPQADKDTQIFTYCRSGGRAGAAVAILEQAGFKNVKNVGGLSDLPNEL